MKRKSLLTIILSVFIIFNISAQSTPSTITLRPGSEEGKDAFIANNIPSGYINQNFGNAADFAAIAWTRGGSESNTRSLVEFDLSIIPANATITNAKLSLYYNPTSANPGHSTLDGSNSSVLQRITQSWGEYSVTWNTMPNTTNVNEVILPQSTANNQDYLDIDVTSLVIDMVNNPSQSFGFMLKLLNESYYRSLLFASSDNANINLHPKLEVSYTINTNIDEHQHKPNIELYPNPSDGSFIVSGDNINAIEIYNIIGEKVSSYRGINNQTIHNIDINNVAKGVYIVKLIKDDGILSRKIVIQ